MNRGLRVFPDVSLKSRSAQLSIPLALPPLNPELTRFVKPIFEKFNYAPVQAAGGRRSY